MRRFRLASVFLVASTLAVAACASLASADPAPTSGASSTSWPLGKPDVVVTMSEPYVHGSHVDQTYRNFILPLTVSHDLWIRGVDFKPSRPQDILQAALFVDTNGKALPLQAHSGAVGYSEFEAGLSDGANRIAEWSPKSSTQSLPNGIAQRIPAGSDLVLLIHFRPANPPEPEQSQVALYFESDGQAREAQTVDLGLPKLYMVATQKATISDVFVLPCSCDVLRVMPHGHRTVVSMHLNAYPPNGSSHIIAEFAKWSVNCQAPICLPTPLRLPAGSRLFFRCNAADVSPNPARPAQDLVPTFDNMDAMASMDVILAPVSPVDNDRLSAAIATRPASREVYRTYVKDTQ